MIGFKRSHQRAELATKEITTARSIVLLLLLLLGVLVLSLTLSVVRIVHAFVVALLRLIICRVQMMRCNPAV
jgi:type III secretory pathway component EscU